MWGFYTDQGQAALLDKVAWTGADWIRVGVGWAGLQPRRPTASDSGLAMNGAVARLDRIVAMASRRGLDVTVTLKTTPGWANGYRPGKVLPSRPADYAWIVAWVARRYAGSVSSIEVYNEPNLQQQTVTTPEQYTRVLCPAHPATTGTTSTRRTEPAHEAASTSWRPTPTKGSASHRGTRPRTTSAGGRTTSASSAK
jgi:aryl-phospho-beta-D-glucosidase BglC (GH1 family)